MGAHHPFTIQDMKLHSKCVTQKSFWCQPYMTSWYPICRFDALGARLGLDVSHPKSGLVALNAESLD